MTGATDLRVIAGRYALEDLVGKGGMGEVWRARHLTLKSKVAIKFLHAATASSESSRRRFLTEAQVTANLKTKHAVQVFDFGVTDDGIPFLVMELLEGETLDKRIARLGKLSIRGTVRILRQAARALDRAHALGIVHRDFKPENMVILTDEEGNDDVKILDFGVAKLVGELEPGREQSGDDYTHLRKPSATTRTGTVVGTPYYMAPEQIHDASNVGPPADIWALGVVAYECLTGERPFEGETVAAVLRDILDGKARHASTTDTVLPEMFDDWFQAACAPQAEARFSDALTAVVALGIALDDSGDRPADMSKPPRGAGGGPQIKTHWSALAETMEAEQSAIPPSETSSPGVQPATSASPTPAEVPPATAVTTSRSTRRTQRLRVLLYTLAAVSLIGLGMVVKPTPKVTSVPVPDEPPPRLDAAPASTLRAGVVGVAAPPPTMPEARRETPAGIPEPTSRSAPHADMGRNATQGAPSARATTSASAPAAPSVPTSATPATSAHPAPAVSASAGKPVAPSPFKLPDLGL